MAWSTSTVLTVRVRLSIVLFHAGLLAVNFIASPMDSMLALIGAPALIARGVMPESCMFMPAGIIWADGWGGIAILTASVSLVAVAVVLAVNCGMRLAGASMIQAAPEDRVQKNRRYCEESEGGIQETESISKLPSILSAVYGRS